LIELWPALVPAYEMHKRTFDWLVPSIQYSYSIIIARLHWAEAKKGIRSSALHWDSGCTSLRISRDLLLTLKDRTLLRRTRTHHADRSWVFQGEVFMTVCCFVLLCVAVCCCVLLYVVLLIVDR
jgi:hypothetical protein